MTTMRLFGRDLTIKYVDSAAAGTNDGSTPANALTALPSHASLAASTIYLVRRGNTQTWTPGANSNSRVVIMAMPLSTDYLYPFLPSEATTAWGADAGTYATINVAAVDAAIAHTGNFFWLHGLDIVEPVSGGVAQSAANNLWSWTTNNFVMTQCKRRLSGYDLTSATGAPGRSARSWKITGNNSFLRDVDINLVDVQDGAARSNSSTAWMMLYGTDCVISKCTGTVGDLYNSTMYAYHIRGDRGRIQDVTINLVATFSTSINSYRMPGGVRMDQCIYGVAKDITVMYLRAITFSGSPTTQAMGPLGTGDGFINLSTCTSLIASGLTADFATNNSFTTNAITTNLILISDNPATATHAKPMSIDTVVAKQADGHTGAAGSTNTGAVNIQSATHAIARNVTGWCLNGTGINISTRTDSSASGNCNASLENGDCKGKVIIKGSVRAHLTSLVSTVSTLTPHVTIDNGGTTTGYTGIAGATECLIESLTLPVGQLTEQLLVTGNCTLGIETCNVTPVYTQGTTIANRGTITINNEAGVTGSWRCRTVDNELKTVNAYRTGGASAAVKLTPLASGGMPAYVGPLAFPALAISDATVGSTGQRTMTIYAAYKGYSNLPDPNNMWIELEVPNGGTGTKTRVINTRGYGSWETDTSAWNNDSGLTIIKQRLPFSYDRAEGVKLRIGCDWWQSGCYALIDPKPVFT